MVRSYFRHESITETGHVSLQEPENVYFNILASRAVAVGANYICGDIHDGRKPTHSVPFRRRRINPDSMLEVGDVNKLPIRIQHSKRTHPVNPAASSMHGHSGLVRGIRVDPLNHFK